ncbi:MAG TPA: LegC family aminotransferase [Chryseosolibacter sp.]
MFDQFIDFVRSYYGEKEGFVPLHAPLFVGNERKYVLEAINSTYVSSVGKFVDEFEASIRQYTGAKYAVATVNGSAALHIALQLAGVKPGDLVITQPLTFIATCNAIRYCHADPLFVDVDEDTLSLSAKHLQAFLEVHADVEKGQLIHKVSRRKITACVPMHTFGHPARMKELLEVCGKFQLPVVEDAAESLGSTYHSQMTGTLGLLGVYSFNGNKTITCGGGGMVVTNDETLGKLGKHLTTQAKKPHAWEFVHDHVGYNYRLPNLNAAMACAQMEQLNAFLESKRTLATRYKAFFSTSGIRFIEQPSGSESNYWLNAILLDNKEQRDQFLAYTNERGVMTRPCWRLMHKLEMFSASFAGDLTTAEEIENRLVNIPSSPMVRAQA